MLKNNSIKQKILLMINLFIIFSRVVINDLKGIQCIKM